MRASRIVGLDLLRAVAVLLVIGRHAPPTVAADASIWQQALDVWRRGGWVGVDLFFVLSGFLVAGVLFREHQLHGRIDYGRFLLRRGFKIYPAFWVLLGATVARAWWIGQPPAFAQFASELLYVQSYWPGCLPHTWSLAVEEHFYFALPLLLALVARRHPSSPPFASLPWVVFALAVSCLCLRCVTASGESEFEYHRHLFPTHLRIDSLLFGVWLSWCWHCRGLRATWARRAPQRLCALAGIALLAPAFVLPLERSWFLNTFGFALNYLGSGLLLVAALAMPSPSLVVRGLAWLGGRSYSIYLWHFPVLMASEQLLAGVPGMLPFVVSLLGSLVVGVGMGSLVEAPVLRLRDRWFPSRATVGPRVGRERSPRRERQPGYGLLVRDVVMVDQQGQVHRLRQQHEERQDAEAEQEAERGGQQVLGIDR